MTAPHQELPITCIKAFTSQARREAWKGSALHLLSLPPSPSLFFYFLQGHGTWPSTHAVGWPSGSSQHPRRKNKRGKKEGGGVTLPSRAHRKPHHVAANDKRRLGCLLNNGALPNLAPSRDEAKGATRDTYVPIE